jgi:hypothetical protein
MYAFIARAIISRPGKLWQFLIYAVFSALGVVILPGCSFIDLELNNRGGHMSLDVPSRLEVVHGPMIRITLHYIWLLSESMEPLSRLDDTKAHDKTDLAFQIFEPQNALEALIRASVFSPALRSSLPSALALLELLQKKAEQAFDSGSIPQHEVWAIKNAYAQFKIAFLAELGTFPSYFVSQKGDRDTVTLLDQAHRMFPSDLPKKVPEAMFDVAEAGKALCYETATACGFHVFRATEAVLRRYYSHATGGMPPPKVRNIMVYVHAMRQRKCGDEKVLSAIEQLSGLHRNPLIHPEAVLTVDEAISILGMAHSAITAMIAILPVLPPTTQSICICGTRGTAESGQSTTVNH